MAIGSMILEVCQQFMKKPVTVQYPFEKIELPKGYRGRPIFNKEACKNCSMCARDCPAQAIVMERGDDGKLRPVFYLDRCIYCGQCSETCPFSAITMAEERTAPQYTREACISKQW